VTDTTYTIELTGATEKILAFIESMGKIKIIEMVRSGTLGISRGIDSLENIK
jgi:acetolactate synthase-1/3 small subunit